MTDINENLYQEPSNQRNGTEMLFILYPVILSCLYCLTPDWKHFITFTFIFQKHTNFISTLDKICMSFLFLFLFPFTLLYTCLG